MRTFVGWVVGFLILFVVYIGLEQGGVKLGLIFFGEPGYSSEGEETSGLTSYGIAATSLSLWLAIWSGMSIACQDWKGGVCEKEWATNKSWLVWSVIMVVITAMSQISFRQFHGAAPNFLHFSIDILAALGVAWSCGQWRKNRIHEIEAREKFRSESQ
jgi:hypothetical protein